MGYRVIVSGVPIECDSMEEAIGLAQKAGGVPTAEKGGWVSASSLGASRWTEARVTELFGLLKGNQRKLLDELLDHPEGRTDAQLGTALGMSDGKALAGVFTGLWKNAKKVGADPNDVYKRKPVTIANKTMKEYNLSDSFRIIAEKVRQKTKK